MNQELPVLDLSVDQETFIRVELPKSLRQLSTDSKPLWGTMTPQYMVEHLIFIFEIALGKQEIKLLTPEEKLPKFIAFLRSKYGFSRNFKFAMLPENDLVPLKLKSLEESIVELEKEIKSFFIHINSTGFTNTLHPYYGSLNKEDSVLFQFKHSMHHLMQFRLK